MHTTPDDDSYAEPTLTATVEAVAPVPLTEDRIGSLDLIRGVAILGILPVNMAFYMAPVEGMTPQPAIYGWWDHAAASAILFLFSGKMITQLAILFGAGLAIQGMRADAAGRPFAGYYLLRMTLLLFIGLNHALLLWYGDILVSYAILGMAALVLRRLSTRALFWCSFGFLAWFYLLMAAVMALTIYAGAGGADQNFDNAPPWLARYLTAANERRIYLNGPFIDMVINRALHVAMYLGFFIILLFWDLLACFLIGICLLRLGVFHEIDANRTLLRRLVLFGLGLGVPLHVVAIVLHARNPLDPAAGILNLLGALPQALGYLALVILWYHSQKWPNLQARFQAVGRMALTNYLMQSVICGLIFYGYGLGYFGQVGHLAGFGIAIGIWALELFWSPIWLYYFQMGPVEWLWRSLADRRLRPFLRTELV